MSKSQPTNVKESNIDRILEIVNQGVILINEGGVVVTYNRAAGDILGVKKEKVLNHKFSDHLEDKALTFSIQKALENKESLGIFRVKIDAIREIEVDTCYLEKSEDEPLEGLIILIRDITAYRKREISAQRKSRMEDLADMASMVAHELRNPLGGIKGFAALLERDLKDTPNLQKMAAHIVKGTDGLNDIVSLVVNYSKPIEGDFKPTNLMTIIDTLNFSALNVEFNNKEVFLHLNEASFKKALENLLINAEQSMPDNGKITLKIELLEEEAILSLSDQGHGISEENLKKAFTPFFSTKPGRNGFGLAEAHKIIEAHDGSIEVDSVVDEGTTFTIKLPYKKD